MAKSPKPRCSDKRPTRVKLPIARTGGMRRSRAGYWRAGVLLAVHVVAALHIAHWMRSGRTISPVEPSESMQFFKDGVVNAGLIFFALAILSTLLLGRWFCGWACHLVALQDLSRWALLKFGIRPKPLRSNLLMVTPLIAFLYMFLGPTAYRLVEGYGLPQTSLRLTTTGFWDTFPSWAPAAMTFLVCGGLIIYFLGAKGFCTFACPYAGIFGVADRFAPLRIRVTDDCEGCGHCTAVCSSNVRVHEEVRDFRMVVDPGCMKCLDCVEVCPNDALYVGFGKPAIGGVLKQPAANRPAARTSGRSVGYAALLVAFTYCAFLAFVAFDTAFWLRWSDWVVAGLGTVVTLAILLVLGRAGRPRAGPSLMEESVLGAAFLLAVLAFRGFHGLIAFLFSLGLAAVVAYLALQIFLLISRRDVAMHGFRLKAAGRLRPAGFGLALLVVGLVCMGIAGARFQVDRHAAEGLRVELHDLGPRLAGPDATPALLEEALSKYRTLLALDPRDFDARLTLGLLLTSAQRFDEASAVYADAARLAPDNPQLLVNQGVLEATRGDLPRATAYFERAVQFAPELDSARMTLAEAYVVQQRWAEAIGQYEQVLSRAPANVDARLMLAYALANSGQVEPAIREAREAARQAPQRPDIRDFLQQLLQSPASQAAPDPP